MKKYLPWIVWPIAGCAVVVLFNYALPHSPRRIVEVIVLAALLVVAVGIRIKPERLHFSLSAPQKVWAKRLFIVGLLMVPAALLWLVAAILLWAPAALVFWPFVVLFFGGFLLMSLQWTVWLLRQLGMPPDE